LKQQLRVLSLKSQRNLPEADVDDSTSPEILKPRHIFPLKRDNNNKVSSECSTSRVNVQVTEMIVMPGGNALNLQANPYPPEKIVIPPPCKYPK
jgi:hypothetical protein